MRLLSVVLLTSLVACDSEAPPAQPTAPPPPTHAEAVTLPVKGIVDIVSTKNGTAEVPGRFEGVTGSVSTSNPATWAGLDGKVDIDIRSWNSGVELRDTRVKTTFFECDSFGVATFDVDGVSGLPADGMPIGAEAPAATLNGKLSLHGVTHDVALPVKIKRVAEDAFTVESTAPYALNSDEYGLTERREALRQECQHDSLSEFAKVSVRVAMGPTEIPGVVPPATPPEAPTEADKK